MEHIRIIERGGAYYIYNPYCTPIKLEEIVDLNGWVELGKTMSETIKKLKK